MVRGYPRIAHSTAQHGTPYMHAHLDKLLGVRKTLELHAQGLFPACTTRMVGVVMTAQKVLDTHCNTNDPANTRPYAQ